jgi:hypothetical protein
VVHECITAAARAKISIPGCGFIYSDHNKLGLEIIKRFCILRRVYCKSTSRARHHGLHHGLAQLVLPSRRTNAR